MLETNKKVVVTGPTGVIGTAVINKLIEENCTVYAVIRRESQRIDNIPIHKNVHIIYCDITELKSLPEKIDEKCDIFYHFAWTGTDNPANRMNMYIQTENIRYALDGVVAAKGLGCSVFIGSGSQAEYGTGGGIMTVEREPKPVSGYGMAKLCAGQMTRVLCQQYGIRHIWMRIVSTYGPNDGKQTFISTVIAKLLAGERPSLTKCEQVWDYLYAGDAADAFWAVGCKGRDGAVYVLGNGTTMTLREYAEIIRQEIGANVEIGYGDVSYYADQVMFLKADVSRLTEDTGWEPQTSFEKGIRKTIEFMLKERT